MGELSSGSVAVDDSPLEVEVADGVLTRRGPLPMATQNEPTRGGGLAGYGDIGTTNSVVVPSGVKRGEENLSRAGVAVASTQ